MLSSTANKLVFYDLHCPQIDLVIQDATQQKLEFFKRTKSTTQSSPPVLLEKDKNSKKLVQIPQNVLNSLPTSLQSKSEKLWLYQILRDAAIASHEESLLEPIADKVQLIRNTGVDVFCVSELPSILIPVINATSGSFFVRTANHFDVWLDYSEASKVSAKLSISVDDFLELSLFHECGHFLATSSENSEKEAWLNAFMLWRNHGKSSESSFAQLFRASLESYYC